MHFIGVDLHKRTVVIAVEDDAGHRERPVSLPCREPAAIREYFAAHVPFRAVIEASTSYRWLYDLVAEYGEIVLAHPRQLRAIVAGRAKTDKLDAKLLARLLRAELIPPAYVPPRAYADLRTLTRARARLSRHATETKNELHALLTARNLHVPFRNAFCQQGRAWLQAADFGPAGNLTRDELLRRLTHYDGEVAALDAHLEQLAPQFPEAEALRELHGIGHYSALLIVAEIGAPARFPAAVRSGPMRGSRPASPNRGHTPTTATSPSKAHPGCAGSSCRPRCRSSARMRRCTTSTRGSVSARARASPASPSPASWPRSVGFG